MIKGKNSTHRLGKLFWSWCYFSRYQSIRTIRVTMDLCMYSNTIGLEPCKYLTKHCFYLLNWFIMLLLNRIFVSVVQPDVFQFLLMFRTPFLKRTSEVTELDGSAEKTQQNDLTHNFTGRFSSQDPFNSCAALGRYIISVQWLCISIAGDRENLLYRVLMYRPRQNCCNKVRWSFICFTLIIIGRNLDTGIKNHLISVP